MYCAYAVYHLFKGNRLISNKKHKPGDTLSVTAVLECLYVSGKKKNTTMPIYVEIYETSVPCSSILIIFHRLIQINR